MSRRKTSTKRGLGGIPGRARPVVIRLPDRKVGRIDAVDPAGRWLRLIGPLGHGQRFYYARAQSWTGDTAPVVGQTILFSVVNHEAVELGPADASEKLGLPEPGRTRGVIDTWQPSVGWGWLRAATPTRGVQRFSFAHRDWRGPPDPAVGLAVTFRPQGDRATDLRPE